MFILGQRWDCPPCALLLLATLFRTGLVWKEPTSSFSLSPVHAIN